MNHQNITESLSKSNSYLAKAWIIWFLGSLFYLYENIIQVSSGVMVSDLMQAFSLSGGQLGGAMAFFFYAYASMQIPVGVLVDRYNVRYLITGALLSCIIGCTVFAHARNHFDIATGRFLIGFGAAFAAVCTMKLATNWFSPKRFSLLVGLMVTLGMLGSIIGERPLAILVNVVGWRDSLEYLAFAGLILSALILLIVRSEPNHSDKLNTETSSSHPKEHLLRGLLTVINNKQSWIIAIYGGLMFASTTIFGGLWGVPFYTVKYGFDKATAAGIVAMLYVGWTIGAPTSGLLVSYLNSHKKVLWIASVGALACMSATLYVPQLTENELDWLMFGMGLFSSFFLPSFTLIREMHPHHNSGAALGFMNMANMVGGALGQPLIGILLDRFWDGSLVEQVRLYSTSNYQWALTTLPLLIFFSIVLLPFIKETSRTH